jgi:hypothetical protein
MVAGAVALPSVSPCCGMPAKVDVAAGVDVVPVDAGDVPVVTGPVDVESLDPTAISTAAAMPAAATAAARRRSRLRFTRTRMPEQRVVPRLGCGR